MDIERLLGKAAEEVSVRRAFGTPIERDGSLIIPVAWVAGGGGAGDSGTSGGPGDAGADGAGTGRGAGFGGVTWPLGVYEVRGGHVRWVPAVDATRIVLAGIAVIRAVVKLRTLGRVKALKRMRPRS